VRAKAAAKPASTRGSVRPSRPTTKANPFTNATAPPKRERFPTASLRVYAKDLATHALQHLPKLGACNGIDGIRRHLIEHLRFNSVATRRRNANYLVNRFFPGDFPHPDLLQFAAAMAGQYGLGDVLFYLTARAEKLVALAADEVVFPALTLGGVSRQKIRDFVQTQLPGSKSAKQVGGAIVATYQKFGVATATRTKLQVCLREGSLPAYAYLLHLEFPEPAMVSFERLLDGPMHRWLLWDREWMVRQLYLLREAGLLSKVSEIDRMRQFTTKLSLAHAVPAIVALTREVAP
jgi:DNA repair protein RadC